jgi:tetratricopeptide (TPR) repeat protein
MADATDEKLREPIAKTVADLASDLTLAHEGAEGPNEGRGGAIFLIGAGCSVSAGIPAAPGVAKHCALKLAYIYSAGAFTGSDADKALEWLQKIWGSSADKFFGDLMSALRIGQPRWVADPISVLKEQGDRLQLPRDELEDVRILVSAFKERVAFADRSRWPEADQAKVRAADLRASGEFVAARHLLDQVDLSEDLDAARLHALNAYSIFERDAENGGAMLDAAIVEFERLIERTDGQNRLENILSLCAALFDKSEMPPVDDAEAAKALSRVADLARRWLTSYGPEDNPVGNSKLNLFLGQALLSLAERLKDQSNLAESEAAYNQAIAGLTANKDPDGQLNDARSGLAAVLQVLGETDRDADKLRRAVGLHKGLVEASRSADGSKEEAGPLENLAGSLTSLARVVNAREAESLLGQAKTALERATQIYQRQGDGDRELSVRHRLDDVVNALWFAVIDVHGCSRSAAKRCQPHGCIEA